MLGGVPGAATEWFFPAAVAIQPALQRRVVKLVLTPCSPCLTSLDSTNIHTFRNLLMHRSVQSVFERASWSGVQVCAGGPCATAGRRLCVWLTCRCHAPASMCSFVHDLCTVTTGGSCMCGACARSTTLPWQRHVPLWVLCQHSRSTQGSGCVLRHPACALDIHHHVPSVTMVWVKQSSRLDELKEPAFWLRR